MQAIRLSILGASGKMGRRILELALADPQFCVASTPARQEDCLSLQNSDVAIDFTSPLATKKHLAFALEAGKPLVIGTTGHSPEEQEEIGRTAEEIPILYSPNFSLGMSLCLEAAELLAKALQSFCSIVIEETHHIHKKDSPSGTARALKQAMGASESIAIRSIRKGDVIGEHTVIFESGLERIELKHTALSRDAFAQGALLGAKFLSQQPPGLYSWKDLSRSSISVMS